jgi:iron complex transport system permease protein
VLPPRARSRSSLLLVATLALALAVALGVSFGAEPASVVRAIQVRDSLDAAILFELRLPRVLLAALAGAGLSAVGAAYQALFRNTLAEPFVLGVSGGAALGASLAIVLDVPGLVAAYAISATLAVPSFAFAGGLGATWLVYRIARKAKQGDAGTTVLLAGVMVNSIAAALITFLKSLVSPSRAQQLLRWLTGSIELPSSLALGAIAVYVGLGGLVLLRDAARLNLIALGDEAAGLLGVNVRKLELRVFIASSCIVGAIVSLTGLIGFVGLVVPHVLRRLVGPDHRKLLPLSMLVGAAALVVCDLGARVAFRGLGSEPPVGAVTALLGGPLFLLLLQRGRR